MDENTRLGVEAKLRLEVKGFLGDLSGYVRYEDINVVPFGGVQSSINVIDVIYNNFWLTRLKKFIKESEIPNKTINLFYGNNNEIIHNNGGVKTLRFETTPLLKAFDEWVGEASSKVDLCKDELYTNKDVAMARVFAFRQHDIECNHWYDKELGLPYSYHLQLVADVGAKFLHLLPKKYQTRALIGCYLHDCVEDARLTFNKLRKRFGEEIAYDACKLTTNVGGLNRAERAGDWYYEGIGEHIVTEFIKFCDRIANMEHSLLHGSHQCKMYAKEMDKFLSRLDYYRELDPMRAHLYKLKEIAE